MDLIDEEDAAGLEVHQRRGQRPLVLDGRAGAGAQVRAHLAGEDVGERGLAQPWRATEEDVLQGFATALGTAQDQLEVVLERLLADEVLQPGGAQRLLELVLLRGGSSLEDLAFVAAGG